jgi:hypothetical protein
MGAEPSFDLRAALAAWDEKHHAAARDLLFGSTKELAAAPPSDDFAAGCLTVP